MAQEPDQSFIYLPMADLLDLQKQFTACLRAIATGQQSYSIAGRSFTRADLTQVSKTLGALAYAVNYQNGTLSQAGRYVYADMSEL